MNIQKLSGIVLISLFLFQLIACNNADDEKVRQEAREKIQPSTGQDDPLSTTFPAPGAEGATQAPASNVPHYICPNNHAEGESAAQGVCPICGEALQHNQAFHGTQPTESANPQQETSPAQNAAGQFHYICSKGCEGGSGANGNCGNCGSPLAHNAAYHQ